MVLLLPFKLLMLIWCMKLVSGYSNAIKVCVSYEEDNSAFLNVEWNWRLVNSRGYGIQVVYHKTLEDDMKFSTVLFPHLNVTSTKISLQDVALLGDTFVVMVSIITKNHNVVGSSSIFQTVVANHLHKVIYKRIGEHNIEFICTMACMSPAIEGCTVTLSYNDSKFTVINNSTRVNSNIEFKSHQVSVQFNGLKPHEHYDYTAVPLMKNKRHSTEKRGTVFAFSKADESSSESSHGSQHASSSVGVTVAISVGVLIVIIAVGVTVLFWCCYKAANHNKEDTEAANFVSMTEEETENETVAPNDVITSSEQFTSSEHQPSNEELSQSMPYCDSDPPSIMASSSNGTVVDDHNQLAADNSLCYIEDDDVFANTPKQNRKMGVATAIMEGEDISEPKQEATVKRKRWYRLIKPKAHLGRRDPNSRRSKVNLQHSGSSTTSFKIRFNRMLGRSNSLIPKQQVHFTSASVIPTNPNLKRGHTFSASNL